MHQTETKNYLVRHYHSDPARLIVVFTSAGGSAPNGVMEEFGKTLSKHAVSTMFVADKHARWYNHSDTLEVFAQCAAIAGNYDYVAALGESMGGSGAIAFSSMCGRVSRVLAFSPQFSIARPFIDFDDRYSWIGAQMGAHVFPTFALGCPSCNIQLLCGDADWRDSVHIAGFSLRGYSVNGVYGGPHDLAAYLKKSPYGNILQELVGNLCDGSKSFDSNDIQKALGKLSLSYKLLLQPPAISACADESTMHPSLKRTSANWR